MDDTEIMSRYLQRGATMLGEHCDDCGNPLFRVQGEEACVVCAAESGGEATEPDDGSEEAAAPDDRGGEGLAAGEASSEDAQRDLLTGADRGDGAVEEIRRDVLAVARRVARDARDERELSRLRDQMAVVESAVEVLDELE